MQIMRVMRVVSMVRLLEPDENDEHDELAPNKGEKVGYGEQIGARQDERCFPGRECPQRQVIEI